MKDADRKSQWINVVLNEFSNSNDYRHIEILKKCGADCALSSTLIEGAVKLRDKFTEKKRLMKFLTYLRLIIITPLILQNPEMKSL